MDHGLYSGYLGMRARQRALDVISNNIANASTPGFKAERLQYQSIEAAANEHFALNAPGTQGAPGAQGPAGLQTVAFHLQTVDPSLASAHGRSIGVVASTSADFSAGQIRQTSRPLDIALDGDGFLVVQRQGIPLNPTQNPGQNERYTRAGSLKLSAAGQLVTQSGDSVIGDNGPITLSPGDITISDSGDISVDGQLVDRLKLVRFDNPQATLLKEGDSLFAANRPVSQPALSDASTKVVQNALEMSNVDMITEMAAMMQNSREFDSLQKSITTMMSDLGRKVTTEIGKI
jgi:flagellar basal-body rod protein FlgG